MRVGIPAEIKSHESRVAITPAGVDALVARGHEVWVQRGAGLGSRISDDAFQAAGARLADSAEETWARGDLLLKVKEPIFPEFALMRADQTVFTYLHLAAAPETARALLAAGTTGIAYETVQLADGSLPLLAPMSEVAGRLSITVGAYHLLAPAGGRGTLLGGVPGTARARVAVIGGGVAGEHAARNALGLGAEVSILDVSLPRLRQLQSALPGVTTLHSSRLTIAQQLAEADLVIGSVLIPGAAAPKLVTDEMVRTMKAGAVLVDIAIDQGGCFEGSRPTTHDDPTFMVHDAVYYCVANMPGAVPETSTRALTNATLPYVLRLAEGVDDALLSDAALSAGLNVRAGDIVHPGVAAALS